MLFTRWLVTALRTAVAQPLYWKFARFRRAAQKPHQVQSALLQRILKYHADTDFARDHHFAEIQSITDFRRQIPIAPYEYLAPYIERVMRGETKALLADSHVLMFALTSGTTSARKHIPITPQYLKDFKRGWNLWGLHAIRCHRPVFLKPLMQLVGDPEEYRTSAGIPCGNLSGFSAQVQKRLIKRLYVVPAETGKIPDALARYYTALRFSLAKPLGILIAANPSTLVNLARFMNEFKEDLVRDFANGTLSPRWEIPQAIRENLTARLRPLPLRAKQMEQFIEQRGILSPMDVWPAKRLLIGCWTGGSVGPYLRQLTTYYGDAPIRDLGLLASEGRMTIPIEDGTPSGVLDITTHYYEFVPETEMDSPQPTVLEAHELREGATYYILLTTKAGLYRYHISDLVRVTGFFENTPTLEFVGKGQRFSNLTGEKLNEYHVTQAVDQIAPQLNQPIHAYAVAPCWDDTTPFYAIILEQADTHNRTLLQKFIQELDAELGRRNIEYAAKRSSQRLAPLRAFIIPTGSWQLWDLQRIRTTGGTPEQYKHPCLINDLQLRKSLQILEEIQG